MASSVEGFAGKHGTTIVGTVVTTIGQDMNFGGDMPYKSLIVHNQGPAPLTNFNILVQGQEGGWFGTLDGSTYTTLGSGLTVQSNYLTGHRYFRLVGAVASGSVATVNTWWIL